MSPHLTMPVALEIGRATFYVFNKIEWGLSFLMIFLISRVNFSHIKWFFAGVLIVILSLETFWFLPILDAKASYVIAGGTENPGVLHKVYIISDVLKVAFALMGAYWLTLPEEK